MKLSRRHLAAAAAFALGAPALIRSAHAQSADEAAVKTAVEELRMAWLKQDKAKIESLTAEQLSYSHSDARLEDKTKFIDGVMSRKATFKSLEWPELTVQVVGNNAIVRHLWVSEKRARRQSHQYQNRRHAGLAETGRRLEAAGACILEAAAAGIAPCCLAPAAPPRPIKSCAAPRTTCRPAS